MAFNTPQLTSHILNTGLKQNGIIKAMLPPQHQYAAAMAVIVLAQCIAVSQFSLTKQPACSSIMVFTHSIDKQGGKKGKWTWIHIALLKCTDSSRLFTTLVTLTHSHTLPSTGGRDTYEDAAWLGSQMHPNCDGYSSGRNFTLYLCIIYVI